MAGWVYLDYYEADDGVTKFDAWLIYSSLAVLSGVGVCSFTVFLLTIKKEYLHTFFTLETDNSRCQKPFLNEENPVEIRMVIFNDNKECWKSIYPKVSEFVYKHWKQWEEDQPEFFSDAWQAKVPSDMIPAANLATLGGEDGRRKSSMLKKLGVEE